MVQHSAPIPVSADGLPIQPPPDDFEDEMGLPGQTSPFQNYRVRRSSTKTVPMCTTRRRDGGSGPRVRSRAVTRHTLNALAYMSDSYFIGTISLIHRLWRYPFKVDDMSKLSPEVLEHVRRLNEWEGLGKELTERKGRPEVGMMVSLDHTIYFRHEPKKVRADDWMFTEMESPWAGDGRGVVTQRIFSKDGTLLATCVQEVNFAPPRPPPFLLPSFPFFQSSFPSPFLSAIDSNQA